MIQTKKWDARTCAAISYCVFETFEYACDESAGVQVSIEDAGVSNKHEQKRR